MLSWKWVASGYRLESLGAAHKFCIVGPRALPTLHPQLS